MKKFNTFTVTMLVTSLMLSTAADAKSSGSFGGRSSSSRPSISVSRPSSPSPTIRTAPQARQSFGGQQAASQPAIRRPAAIATGGLFGSGAVAAANQPSAKPAPIKVTRDNVMASLNGGKSPAKGEAAGVLYKDFQAKNKPPIAPDRKLVAADLDKVFTPNYRQDRRRDFYSSYQPTPATHYRETVHMQHSGGYGMWDYMMFDSIMDNVGDRQMYYHHQNDQAFRDWRTDANAACAAGDTDVCEKLKDLDREMGEYKAKGIAQNPRYITPGVDASVYEAANIDMSKLGEIKLCTGSVGSDYGRYATALQKVTKMKVVTVPSNGSADNLAKIATGECNLGFAQDDLSINGLVKVITPKQLEVAMLICPKSSNIDDIGDLSNKHIVYVGSDQTGSQFTFDKLKSTVSGFTKASVNIQFSVLAATGTVKESNNSCLFTVSTPESPSVMELDKAGKHNMIALPSTAGYTAVNIDKGHYKTLTQDQYIHRTGFLWLSKEGGTDSVGITTSLVTSQAWTEQNKQLYDLLLLERTNLQLALQ